MEITFDDFSDSGLPNRTVFILTGREIRLENYIDAALTLGHEVFLLISDEEMYNKYSGFMIRGESVLGTQQGTIRVGNRINSKGVISRVSKLPVDTTEEYYYDYFNMVRASLVVCNLSYHTLSRKILAPISAAAAAQTDGCKLVFNTGMASDSFDNVFKASVNSAHAILDTPVANSFDACYQNWMKTNDPIETQGERVLFKYAVQPISIHSDDDDVLTRSDPRLAVQMYGREALAMMSVTNHVFDYGLLLGVLESGYGVSVKQILNVLEITFLDFNVAIEIPMTCYKPQVKYHVSMTMILMATGDAMSVNTAGDVHSYKGNTYTRFLLDALEGTEGSLAHRLSTSRNKIVLQDCISELANSIDVLIHVGADI